MKKTRQKPDKILADITAPAVQPESDFVSTGSTLLNLALTGNPHKGYRAGSYYNLVGDSSSGKSFLLLTCMAEAMQNKKFKDYELIHDNPEDGTLMDYAHFFGAKMAARVRSPSVRDGEPSHSETIEDFYDNLHRLCKAGKPFIYGLDSMDALTSEAEEDLNANNRKAREKGTESKGSYGDGKAKYNSTHLRTALREIKRCKGILIVVSQTRDNMDPMAFAKKTMAGGRAIKFYATAQIWTSVKGPITVKVRDRTRSVGMTAIAAVKKNRVTGRDRSVQIPFYFEHGLDDTLACIDYLVAEGHWKKSKGVIRATDFEMSGTRREIAAHVDEKSLHRTLSSLVGDVWEQIETSLSLKRKPRYV